jgi:hypothetical protein
VSTDAADNIYVADTENNTIRKMTLDGTNWVVTTLAGRGGVSGSANGTGSAARLFIPYALAVDGAGNVYVADTYNHTIRKGQPPLMITVSRLNGEQYAFPLSGVGGQEVIVDASDDLANWTPIWTNTLTFPTPIIFTDPQPASTRFYRARTP